MNSNPLEDDDIACFVVPTRCSLIFCSREITIRGFRKNIKENGPVISSRCPENFELKTPNLINGSPIFENKRGVMLVSKNFARVIKPPNIPRGNGGKDHWAFVEEDEAFLKLPPTTPKKNTKPLTDQRWPEADTSSRRPHWRCSLHRLWGLPKARRRNPVLIEDLVTEGKTRRRLLRLGVVLLGHRPPRRNGGLLVLVIAGVKGSDEIGDDGALGSGELTIPNEIDGDRAVEESTLVVGDGERLLLYLRGEPPGGERVLEEKSRK
ncbi:hypothetical protein M5K25_023095 [Dendrobium thyrsiflorum]|uniref:Uncharacterized protein n=1 Tax=Dendrobium thyrsiflorum TaxID=117978 RepID=A0ABD0UEJ2_DENTH